ncbi:MAG: T9SS type A sorting domain-containing protein [Bacteroidetes bacterium]|nr:T9SS type A sorting domain-containing protein [Bacteroidota bacterium]
MVRTFLLLISILCAVGDAYSQYKIKETFETAVYPPTGWTENDASDIISRSTSASGFGFGTGSIKADFFNVTSGTSTLTTQSFSNLSGNDTLVFDYAYAPYTGYSPDSLYIRISTDNGATFNVTLGAYLLSNIATATATDFEFTPGAGQWATIKLKLDAAVTGNTSLVQFGFVSNYGNSLFIDNITLGNTPTVDIQALSIENRGTQYFTSSNISPYGKYRNNGTTLATVNVTRTISPGGYSSTLSMTHVTPGEIRTGIFDPFSFSPGNTYTVRDSVYFSGDGDASNDTLSGTFIPKVANTVLLYWNDAASKDSLVTHLNAGGYSGVYDVISMSEYAGSLLAWRSVFALFGTGTSWNDAIRDSLKSFLDNSVAESQKTLAVFGNDLALVNDPIYNNSASISDTTFLRQYLHAQYIGDNWLTSVPLAASVLKGTGSLLPIASSVITDASPDFVKPVNNGVAGLVPFTEDGNGDTATTVIYDGTTYNSLFCTNLYSKFSTNTNMVFTTISQWVFDSSGVLPVELANFSYDVEQNNVNLKWMTVSENNNSGFDIERKLGNSSWQRISFVRGNSTSNTQHSYSYTDNITNAGVYNYRLKQIDFNGNYKYYNLNSEVNIGAPKKFTLKQNYPNPFNPSTNIEYELPDNAKVMINIYDVTGRLAGTLVNDVQNAGYYKVQFDAGKMNLASGLYIYQIVTESPGARNVKSLKMLLIK